MSIRKTKDSKIWISRPNDPDDIRRLAAAAKVSPLIAQLFYARGISQPDEVKAFLAPASLSRGLYPPNTLPGCDEAARVIFEAIQTNKKITVYGDYDVDGMTATAILVQAIEILGGRVSYFVPNRLDEGYGLNCDSLKRLQDDGTDLVVTVDCGIASIDVAKYAREIGMRLVITDHHTPVKDPELRLPDAEAIVHPYIDRNGENKTCPWPELCGAVVALKLAWALGIAAEGKPLVGEKMRNFLVRAVGLAALGTIADVVPLRDENRTIVRFALVKSLQDKEHLPTGLQFLIEVAGLTAYHKQITSEDIGFSIAPRLNAAGREVLCEGSCKDETDEKNWQIAKELFANPNRLAAAGQMGLASLGVELLITDRKDRARELAPFINNLNETRQKLERKMMSEALRMIESEYQDAPAFVLASRDWHPGVIGIVAGRIAEHYHRPAVMIALKTNDPGTGSGRGIPDSEFSLYEAFKSCRHLLVRFGGHAAAAGLGIKEENITEFRELFCDYVTQNLKDQSHTPKIKIDGEYPLSTFNPQTVAEIDRMSPFGEGNSRPVFVSYGVSLAMPARRVGTKTKVKIGSGDQKKEEMLGRTFSAKFRQFRDVRRSIAFGQGDWADQMNALVEANPNTAFDIAYHVTFNDYCNQVELRLLDWRVSEKKTGR